MCWLVSLLAGLYSSVEEDLTIGSSMMCWLVSLLAGLYSSVEEDLTRELHDVLAGLPSGWSV